MDEPGAASEAAALSGQPREHATAAARILGLLAEVARVAASALFGVASVIGVVEVAARQWTVAKAKKRKDLPGTNDCRPPRKSNQGPSGTTTIAE
jgi:hypothetical protein